MVGVLSPFGISITNCFSRNYTKIQLPLQPPSLRARRSVGESLWAHVWGGPTQPEFRLLLHGYAVGSSRGSGPARRPVRRRAITQPLGCQRVTDFVAPCTEVLD